MTTKKVLTDRIAMSHADQLKLLQHYRRTRDGLFLPTQAFQTCGGCGRETYNLKTGEYFGETFCVDCIEKWKHGAK